MSKHTGRGAMITQSDLAKFQALKAARTEHEQRYSEERNWLLQLVDQHATVEPGPLSIAVEDVPTHRITKEYLVEAVGKDGYAQMLREAPLTIYRYIKISGAPHTSAHLPVNSWT